MKKLLGSTLLSLLWCSISYSSIITQDLIDALIETKRPNSTGVVKNLKFIGTYDKFFIV
jgi:hypothetical protein